MTIGRGCNNCKHGPKYLCQFNNNGQLLNTIIKFTKNGYEISFHEDPISGLVITFRNRAGARICRTIPYKNLKDSTIAIPFYINEMMYRLAVDGI